MGRKIIANAFQRSRGLHLANRTLYIPRATLGKESGYSPLAIRLGTRVID